MTNLNRASRQWATRPADERFQTMQGLKKAVDDRFGCSIENSFSFDGFSVEGAGNGEVVFRPSAEIPPFKMTNWAFGQLAGMAHAPAQYLRTLSPDLASNCLNFSIGKVSRNGGGSGGTKMLAVASADGDPMVRAFTSLNYGRIWDHQLVEAAMNLQQRNPSWKNPPARKISGDGSGEETENAGLYASDRDVFIFLVDENHKIQMPGKDGDLLSRGFFVWNSEVGSATFGMTTFLYRYVCGNHIVWGAEQVHEIRIRHTSHAPERAFVEVLPALNAYLESSASAEESVLKRASDKMLPRGEGEAVDFMAKYGFTKAEANASIEYAKAEEGDARTLLQIVNGATAYARDRAHTDARVVIERKAGKLLQGVSLN